ncbi:hypothetical protein J2S16_002943 [Cytobacillus kochii]|uniref:Uncharacterized protein n=1 Tax=Cytobacillus kochii TaxID=859143 RepID=A0A248TH97_9BACI|nr:hypothetical protein CKF48_09795 [Cytobacillus kochii]MDQ0186335.1 hypothetical protein [Cytobacillus kochii]
MKKIDAVHLLFLMYFLYHFADLNYDQLSTGDYIISGLAIVWAILFVYILFLRWRVKRDE